MDHRALFDLVVQLQSVTPKARENGRALSIIDALRRNLSVIEEPFVYTAQFDNLASGATATDLISIQADADFKIMAATFQVNNNGAVLTSATAPNQPNVSVLLTDTGNGRNLMDQAIPIPCLFGTGQLPFIWPVPKLMSARSTLQVQATSFEAAQAWDLTLHFIGVKLYPLG
jgi:hypothetical protein